MGIFGHSANDDDAEWNIMFQMQGAIGLCPTDCVVTSITAKLLVAGSNKVKAGIYGPTDDVSAQGSPPYWSYPFIASTDERTLTLDAPYVAGWETFNFSAGNRPTLQANKHYLLVVWADNSAGVRLRQVTVAVGTGLTRCTPRTYAENWPNPQNFSIHGSDGHNGLNNDWIACIYCTYESVSDPTSPIESASGLWPREYFISGYLPRYQKRQVVGYHSASGDLRPIEVNASGHLFTDIEVEVSSGQHVVISGQPVTISGDHVFIESGAYVVADIAESGIGVQVQSGLHVMISGQHVHLESGDTIDTYLYGQHVLSGDWRPISVCSSGEVVVCSGLYVVADIAESGIGVQVQSGLHVVVSGQPVTISGDHVFVESGIARLHGYHPASGIWVPIAVTLSGCIAMTYCSSGGIFG